MLAMAFLFFPFPPKVFKPKVYLPTMVASLQVLMAAIFLSQMNLLATGLSFDFTGFNVGDLNISYEEAYPADQAIQLTNNMRGVNPQAKFGRATYFKSMQLWDRSSGNLTDFNTHFSFVIDSQGNSIYGDGLAFFLAPEGSKLPPKQTQGCSLGLTFDGQELNTFSNRFVAVEFDIFSNDFDPPGEHVGININSLESVNNITWFCSIMTGKMNDAWISYNSSTHNLSVAFTGNDTLKMQYLSEIVDLRDYLPERVTFGFSAATGELYAIHRVYSWHFSSTLEIHEKKPILTPPSEAPSPISDSNPTENGKKRRLPVLPMLLGVSGALVVVGGLIWLFLVYWKKDEEVGHVVDEYMEDEFEKGTGPRKFSYRELARATNNFKDEKKLGEGGFGGVYKGFLKDTNSDVAVKRVSRWSKQGVKEYAAEVKIISRLRHRNLVQLIGWCHERNDLLLVYEFMHNGSLDSHLFREISLLTWEVRFRIAQGIASGLLYLHEEWEQCVVHRDIKSSNVMLDSNFNAKLGDFGLARMMEHGKGLQTTVLAGTMGYMAPECLTTGKASRESDVYSFGVVALEIACGRKPINTKANEEEVHMVSWVWDLYGRGKLLEAADPRLCGDFDVQQMERLMIVGLWCSHPDENLRPSIRQSIHVLNFETPLPDLPLKMPVPMYLNTVVKPFSFSLSCGPTLSKGIRNQSSTNSYNANSYSFR